MRIIRTESIFTLYPYVEFVFENIANVLWYNLYWTSDLCIIPGLFPWWYYVYN
jgi:hypothetical protein